MPHSRKNWYKWKYNITLEQIDQKLENQNNCCAICKKEFQDEIKGDKIVKGFRVDHNHTTGQVRHLLCQKCNALLGMSNENISILESTIEYIKEFN